MITRQEITFVFMLCTAGLSVLGQETTSQSLKKDLNTYFGIQKEKIGFNGVVMIVRRDSVIFQENFGLASIEHHVPIKVQSKFRIASVSKTFTAALVAMAKDEGLVRFEDKLSRHLANLPTAFSNITLHQLLSHTSGIPHHDKIPEYWRVKSKLSLTTDQILKEIFQMNLLFQPGTQMQYSSLGYYLLALVLEKVYAQSYQQVLEQKILKPLKLTSTGTVNNLSILTDMAGGYQKLSEDSLIAAPYRDYNLLKGAGDLYSTAPDLLRWCNAILSDEYLHAGTKTVIFSPNLRATNKEESSYGYGWYIRNSGSVPMAYHHGGGTWGYSSYAVMYPKEKLIIILLCNVATLPMESIWQDIEKIVFRLPFEMPVIERTVSLPGEALTQYAGKYISEPGGRVLTIALQNNKLYAQLSGNPPFEIFHKGDHSFFGKTVDSQFIFAKNSSGDIAYLTVTRKDQVFTFRKY